MCSCLRLEGCHSN
uniref:Uncharacterized protein n=1 Tax=Arundo donax TaxID=35708 RepID=A0A0A9EDH2_ARUDO